MKIYLKNPTQFKALLKRSGYSQTLFTVKVGMSRNYLTKIISGQSVGAELASKICESLNVTFDDIFFLDLVTKVI